MPVTDTAGATGVVTSPGFRHDVGFYSTDDEFKDLIVPFVEAGLERGEAVIFAYEPYKMDLLRSWLPASDAISYVSDTSPYASPALALDGWRRLVEGQLEKGHARVRIAGNVPHPGYGVPYAGWDRYEMAIDRAWGATPTWARCLYDTRIAPNDVLDRARSVHRHLAHSSDGATPDEHENPAFRRLRSLSECLPPPLEHLEEGEPLVELVDPAPASVRKVVEALAPVRVGDDVADELCLAVSEVVSNAMLHGRPPVTVGIWAAARKVAVVVRDEGPGPDDPLAGLLEPLRGAPAGRGLWIVHRLGLGMSLDASDGRFAVRLIATPT